MNITERSVTGLSPGDILVDHDFAVVDKVRRPEHRYDEYRVSLTDGRVLRWPAAAAPVKVTDTMPAQLPMLTKAEVKAVVEAVRVLRWAADEAHDRGDIGDDVMWTTDADALAGLLVRYGQAPS